MLQESTKVLTANSQLSLVPTLALPASTTVSIAENGMSLNPQNQTPVDANPVKIERLDDAELGVEEILVNENERIESPDSSYTSPTHLGDGIKLFFILNLAGFRLSASENRAI